MPRQRKQKTVNAFTANFTATLQQRSLSIKQAADLMGLPYTTVVGFTNGAMPTDMEAISRFCTALSLNFEFLMTGKTKNIDPSQIPLDQIFTEDTDASFSGIYRIEARKLSPRADKKKGQP
jgi:hypothetical protein